MRKTIIVTVLIILIPLALQATSKRTPKFFDGKRIIRKQKIIFKYPVKKVFPLLCPVREYEWMSSWKGVTAYTKSGFAEKYVVFYHRLPFPLWFKKAYWVASQYESNKLIQWVVTVPNVCIIIIDEKLKGIPKDKTEIDYVYTVTGLTNHGNRVIEKMFSEERLNREINRTRQEIEYYLETGRMLDTEFKSKMFD